MREGQDILLLLVLKHYNRCNRRDVETAAAKEPERTAAVTGTTQWMPPPQRRAPLADAQADVVQAAEEWATTVDNAAAWTNTVLVDDTKAP